MKEMKESYAGRSQGMGKGSGSASTACQEHVGLLFIVPPEPMGSG